MPACKFELTQILQHLEANDVRVTGQVPPELRTEAGNAEGARQGFRLENADVSFRQHIGPLDQVFPVWPGIPGSVEEQSPRLQESADAAQHVKWIFHMLQHLDCGNDIERAGKRRQLLFAQNRDSASPGLITDPAGFEADDAAIVATITNQASIAATEVKPIGMGLEFDQRVNSLPDSSPLVDAYGLVGPFQLKNIIDQRIDAATVVVFGGVDGGIVRQWIRDKCVAAVRAPAKVKDFLLPLTSLGPGVLRSGAANFACQRFQRDLPASGRISAPFIRASYT